MIAAPDAYGYVSRMVGMTLWSGENWPSLSVGNDGLSLEWNDAEGETTRTVERHPRIWDPVKIERRDAMRGSRASRGGR